MKMTKYIVAIVFVITVVAVLSENLLSWGLFNFFSDTEYSQEGRERAENFDPDRDILFLPELGDKKLFDSMGDLSIIRKKSVRRFLYTYLTSGREYVKRAIQRSYLYKDTIDEIMKEYPDVPRELALIPLLESGFDPCAVSRSKAMGLWQFMGNTSTPLGLKVNVWVDERRNIEKSTRAALNHLRHLYKTYKRWDLVLAAYNGGSGYVSRSMEKTGAKDIWELIESKTLRQETDEYVPRFIALALIYKNQWLFGIKDEIPMPYRYRLHTVRVPFSVHLMHVSDITGMKIEEIRMCNPELQKDIIPPQAGGYPLRLTAKGSALLSKNLQKLEPLSLPAVTLLFAKEGINQ